MRYEQKSFTLPVSENCTQKRWDLSFMTREEFMAAYEISSIEYDELVSLARE